MSNAFKALQHLRQNPGRRLDQDDSDPQYASPAQSQQSRRLGRTSAGEPINQSGHVWGSMKRRTTDTTATTSNDSSIGYAIVPEVSRTGERNHVSNDAAAFIRISSITIPQDSSDQPGRIEDNGMGNSTENLLLWILLLVVLAAPPLLNFIAYLEVHNETRERDYFCSSTASILYHSAPRDTQLKCRLALPLSSFTFYQ
ncbi:unnamed protein product, partial [Mesorhabditis belari]|uniref:Uncharacterized protein n=1 Tax=Mesorhabditis belari TaxID=2138241 RepID=A0AAF3J8Z8_9BILA